jgi:hypothetical protein
VSAPARRLKAALAAAIAAFGLCLGPVLHGELHARERERALQRLFELAFERDCSKGHADAVARALEEALSGESHRHGDTQGTRQHGEGSLAHFALATHPAPLATPLPLPAELPEVRVSSYASAHLVPRYLVVERSQAPPGAGSAAVGS